MIPLLRASSLPVGSDCARRTIAELAPDLIREVAGINVRRRPKSNHIGPAIGKACHKAETEWLSARERGDSIDPEQVARDTFTQILTTDGVDFDNVTKSAEVAYYQIGRMVSAHIPYAAQMQPLAMEFELIGTVDGVPVSGHPDILERNGIMRDLKFGKKMSPYEAQLGAYSLLGKQAGLDVTRTIVDWTPRGAKTKPQPDPVIMEYDINVAEEAARRTVDALSTQITKFTETQDPWSIQANPNSNLCSKKWCVAWGTEFCKLGRPDTKEEQ
jgi:hypothetical protein